MTELASRANAATLPAGDLPAIKSTSCPCPGEGTVEDFQAFGDILANVAPQAASKDEETSSGASSGDLCGPSAQPGVIPTGLPQALTQLIASLSSASSAGSPLQGSDATPGQTPDGLLSQLSLTTTGQVEEVLPFERPVGLQAASSRRPDPNLHQTPDGIRSVFSARSEAVVGEETDAVRAQNGAMLFTGTLEKAIAHELTENREADAAFARASGSALQSTVDTVSGTLAVPTSEPTFAHPVHVTALETYLPAIILRTAVELAAPIDDVGRVTPGASPTEQPGVIRVKILTFDLHPAALGPLTVRMRMNGKQIEIAIEARTEAVCATLAQTREAMVEALAGHGLRIETPDIRLAASPLAIEPKPAMQDQSATADAGGLMQDRGHDHHDRRHASTHHASPGEEEPRKTRSGPLVTDKPVGIFL